MTLYPSARGIFGPALAALALLILASCYDNGPTHERWPAPPGRIYYTLAISPHDPLSDDQAIFAMDADGANNRDLMFHSLGYDIRPVPSPDGSRIAFLSKRDGKAGIYIMGNDGTGVTKVTDLPASAPDADVSWSHDGSRIAFSAKLDPSREQVFTCAVDGGAPVALTDTTSNNFAPSYTPDGQILFSSNRDWDPHNPWYPNSSMYMVDADGTGLRRMAYDGSIARASPDGNYIAFRGGDSGSALRLMPKDGSWSRQLADGFASYMWRPDGRAIVFARDVPDRNISLVDLDGNITVLTPSGSGDSDPCWSPDGARIVFSRQHKNPYETVFHHDIFAMDPDGTNLLQLTNTIADKTGPRWGPR